MTYKEKADRLEAKLTREIKSGNQQPGLVDRALLLASYRWLDEHEDEHGKQETG